MRRTVVNWRADKYHKAVAARQQRWLADLAAQAEWLLAYHSGVLPRLLRGVERGAVQAVMEAHNALLTTRQPAAAARAARYRLLRLKPGQN